MTFAVRTAAVSALVVLLTACGTTVTPPPTATEASTGTPDVRARTSAQKTCGRVTPSTGILRDVLQVHLSGPSRLVTGSPFQGTVTVSLRPGVRSKRVVLDSGAPVLPVITRGIEVVGAYEGGVGGVGVRATVTAARPFRFPADLTSGSVLLRGCPDLPVDPGAPDMTRRLLPPGRYVIYAYVSDLSGNNTATYGVLRSQPLSITVTGPAG